MPDSAVLSALEAELAHAREETDNLFRLIDPASVYDRPIAERHRLIFYLGHFEAFDWNLLARRGMNAPAFNATFDRLFERGIDPAPGQAAADSAHDWPSREEVEQYNAKTRTWIDAHLDEIDPELVQMAIEHRHMHAETFAYLMHGLPYEKKMAVLHPPASLPRRPAPRNPMVEIESGAVILGKEREGFGWDNEHLAHRIDVPGFSITGYKVSNGEYLEFVRAGGVPPHFWSKEKGDNGAWFYRGMFERIPLPLDRPAWVTWNQANAFAKWRGLHLPSEAQFHLAAERTSPDPVRDNFGFHAWDPVAVDAGHQGREQNTDGSVPAAPAQMIGNGWEWTRDLFAPFEGFEPHAFYPGYSADFFDRQHYVMKGASPRTAKLLTRASFRNWFRPDYPYMYAGFRLVSN